MKMLLNLAFVSLLLGCVVPSSKKMVNISAGQSKTDVIAILGKPASASLHDGYEYLNFRLSGRGPDWFLAHDPLFADDYYVRFKDGRVDAYGRADQFPALDVNLRSKQLP